MGVPENKEVAKNVAKNVNGGVTWGWNSKKSGKIIAKKYSLRERKLTGANLSPLNAKTDAERPHY